MNKQHREQIDNNKIISQRLILIEHSICCILVGLYFHILIISIIHLLFLLFMHMLLFLLFNNEYFYY